MIMSCRPGDISMATGWMADCVRSSDAVRSDDALRAVAARPTRSLQLEAPFTMKVTQDDATRFAVDNSASGIWMIAGLLVLGTVGGVWFTTNLIGAVDPIMTAGAGFFLAFVVPLLIGTTPSVGLSFEHGLKQMRIRRSWPLFTMETAIDFAAFERVDVAKSFGKNGSVSHRLVMRLRSGRRVWLGQMTWHDEQEIRTLAERMNMVLGVAPQKARRKA